MGRGRYFVKLMPIKKARVFRVAKKRRQYAVERRV